jgi:hypothetical protein
MWNHFLEKLQKDYGVGVGERKVLCRGVCPKCNREESIRRERKRRCHRGAEGTEFCCVTPTVLGVSVNWHAARWVNFCRAYGAGLMRANTWRREVRSKWDPFEARGKRSLRSG